MVRYNARLVLSSSSNQSLCCWGIMVGFSIFHPMLNLKSRMSLCLTFLPFCNTGFPDNGFSIDNVPDLTLLRTPGKTAGHQCSHVWKFVKRTCKKTGIVLKSASYSIGMYDVSQTAMDKKALDRHICNFRQGDYLRICCVLKLRSIMQLPLSAVILLTHWGRDKISQLILTNAFSWMNVYKFRLKFHWSMFLKVQSTIFQHWMR